MKFEFIDSANVEYIFQVVDGYLSIKATSLSNNSFSYSSITSLESLNQNTLQLLVPSGEAIRFWTRIWSNKAFL